MHREPHRNPLTAGLIRRRLRTRVAGVRAAPRGPDAAAAAIETLLAASALPVLLFDVSDWRLIDVGGTFEAMLGYPRTRIQGRLATELEMFSGGNAAADLQRLLSGGPPLSDRDWTLRRADGATVQAIAAAKIATLGDMRVALVQLTDNTDRKLWLEVQSRTREDFVNIFMHSPQPLCISDVADERYLHVNDAWRKLYGHAAPDAVGRTAAELDIWASQEERRRVLRMLAEDGWFENIEARHRHRDGGVMDVLLAGQIKSLDGNSVIVWQAMDISERKRYEHAVRRLNAELEKRVADRTGELRSANEELEAFSYTVAHDLRAPLRAIDGYSSLLGREHAAQLGGDAAIYLDRIRGNIGRMAQLIDDLLAFAKVGRRDFGAGRVDMNRLAQEVVEGLLRDDPRAIVNVSALPPVCGDPAMLRQVLENLLSNALKFTSGKELPRIEVGCVPGEAADTFFVRDNGVGFDMGHAGKLFGVFERLHSAREYPGTGVGLAIVQRIVQRHRGRVWAEAAPGAGATFYFELPHPAERDV